MVFVIMNTAVPSKLSRHYLCFLPSFHQRVVRSWPPNAGLPMARTCQHHVDIDCLCHPLPPRLQTNQWTPTCALHPWPYACALHGVALGLRPCRAGRALAWCPSYHISGAEHHDKPIARCASGHATADCAAQRTPLLPGAHSGKNAHNSREVQALLLVMQLNVYVPKRATETFVRSSLLSVPTFLPDRLLLHWLPFARCSASHDLRPRALSAPQGTVPSRGQWCSSGRVRLWIWRCQLYPLSWRRSA